jgi:hypothetical protein
METKEILRLIAVIVNDEYERDEVIKVFEANGYTEDITSTYLMEYPQLVRNTEDINDSNTSLNYKIAPIHHPFGRRRISFVDFEKEFILVEHGLIIGDRVKLVGSVFNDDARDKIGVISDVCRSCGLLEYVVSQIQGFEGKQYFNYVGDIELVAGETNK